MAENDDDDVDQVLQEDEDEEVQQQAAAMQEAEVQGPPPPEPALAESIESKRESLARLPDAVLMKIVRYLPFSFAQTKLARLNQKWLAMMNNMEQWQDVTIDCSNPCLTGTQVALVIMDAGTKELKSLHLRGPSGAEWVIAILSLKLHCQNLQSLKVDLMEDDDLDCFDDVPTFCPNLKKLYIGSKQIAKKIAPVVVGFQHLRSLALIIDELGSRFVNPFIESNIRLRELALTAGKVKDPAMLPKLLEWLHESVYILNLRLVSGEDIPLNSLENAPVLHTFGFRTKVVSESTVKQLPIFATMSNLLSLTLKEDTVGTDGDLESPIFSTLEAFRKTGNVGLEKLVLLLRTKAVSRDMLDALATTFPKLKDLTFSLSSDLTSPHLLEFVSKLPELQKLTFGVWSPEQGQLIKNFEDKYRGAVADTPDAYPKLSVQASTWQTPPSEGMEVAS